MTADGPDATDNAPPTTDALQSESTTVPDAQLTAIAAGQLNAVEARQVRARLAADPQLLAAYGALRARRHAADLLTPPFTPAEPDPDDRLRPRLTRGRLALLAVVTAATVCAVLSLGEAPTGLPAPGMDTTPMLTTTAAQLGNVWPTLAAGPIDLGFMTEQDRMRTCWPFGTPLVLGARPVIIDGRYGVAVATPAPDQPDRVRLTVLSRNCGVFTDGVLAQTDVPRA